MLTKVRGSVQTLEREKRTSRNNLESIFAPKKILEKWKLVYVKIT